MGEAESEIGRSGHAARDGSIMSGIVLHDGMVVDRPRVQRL